MGRKTFAHSALLVCKIVSAFSSDKCRKCNFPDSGLISRRNSTVNRVLVRYGGETSNHSDCWIGEDSYLKTPFARSPFSGVDSNYRANGRQETIRAIEVSVIGDVSPRRRPCGFDFDLTAVTRFNAASQVVPERLRRRVLLRELTEPLYKQWSSGHLTTPGSDDDDDDVDAGRLQKLVRIATSDRVIDLYAARCRATPAGRAG